MHGQYSSHGDGGEHWQVGVQVHAAHAHTHMSRRRWLAGQASCTPPLRRQSQTHHHTPACVTRVCGSHDIFGHFFFGPFVLMAKKAKRTQSDTTTITTNTTADDHSERHPRSPVDCIQSMAHAACMHAHMCWKHAQRRGAMGMCPWPACGSPCPTGRWQRPPPAPSSCCCRPPDAQTAPAGCQARQGRVRDRVRGRGLRSHHTPHPHPQCGHSCMQAQGRLGGWASVHVRQYMQYGARSLHEE